MAAEGGVACANAAIHMWVHTVQHGLCINFVIALQVRPTVFLDSKFVMTHNPCQPCVSPDDAFVAAGSDNGAIYIWNVLAGGLLQGLSLREHHQVSACAWGQYGLVSADKAGNIHFWT